MSSQKQIEVPDDSIRAILDSIHDDAVRELSLTLPEVHQIRAVTRSEGDDEIAWREDPVTFHEFVNDPWHMNQPPLGPRQRKDIEDFLGADPKKIFSRTDLNNNLYREAVLVWGKGGGKDWICTMVQCYLVYVLLCMEDPRAVVALAPHEAVDILNVAYSAKQANEVYFTKFLQRVLHWAWLKHKYPITQHRAVLNRGLHKDAKLLADGSNFVKIGSSMIQFPHHIRAISEHSENESYEGYNILFWVMDEAAAFKSAGKKANAHKIYGTLRSSAVSRFPQLWRGMMISYPRSADDFIMTKYGIGKDDPDCFTSLAYTWEANPTKVEGDFDKEKKNPVEYEAKYKCNPPPRFGAAFDPVAVDSCVDYDRISLIKTKEAVISQQIIEAASGRTFHKQFVGKALLEVLVNDLKQKALPRVFHVDGGLTNCSAGFVLAHGEPVIVQGQVLNKVVIDVVLRWHPIPSRRLQVSLNNIASLIKSLSSHVKIVRGSYDQWNSQSAIEALILAGIPVEERNVVSSDYIMLDGLINLGCVSIPGDTESEFEQLTTELKNLVRYSSGGRQKFDVPKEEGETLKDNFGGPRYTKDLADCLAGVSFLLNDPEVRAEVSGTMAPRPVRGPSLSASRPQAPLSVHRQVGGTQGQGGIPNKLPFAPFPEESGFMGQQMDNAGQRANQHVMLSNINGQPRLKGSKQPNMVRPPTPITNKR